MKLLHLRNLIQWAAVLQGLPWLPPCIENASSCTGAGLSKLPQLWCFPGPDSASLTRISPAAGDNSSHSELAPLLQLWTGILLKQLQYICAGPAAGGRIPILTLIPYHVSGSDRSLQITSSNKRWSRTFGCDISSPHKHGEEPNIQQGRPQAMSDRFGAVPKSSHTSCHMKGYPSLPCALKLWDWRTKGDRQQAGFCVGPCGWNLFGSAALWFSLKPRPAVINSAKRGAPLSNAVRSAGPYNWPHNFSKKKSSFLSMWSKENF